jgi:hypothetical protein
MCELSNLEMYQEKAREYARAADEARSSGERIELLCLASVYTALADYVDRQRRQGAQRRPRPRLNRAGFVAVISEHRSGPPWDKCEWID